MSLADHQSKIDRLRHEAFTAKRQYRDERKNYKLARRHIDTIIQAQSILQDLAQAVQTSAHKRIAGVVTECLHAVFGSVYDFRIDFIRKRGKTEAQLFLIHGGLEVVDATSEDSGGVLDVAAFGLRLACLILSKPYLERVLFLDEPFRFVSASYRENVKNLLTSLSERFGLQIVMVTHQTEYRSGKVVML